jgi:hypothetical protein
MGRRVVNGSCPPAGPRHRAGHRSPGRGGQPGRAVRRLRSGWQRPRRRLAAGGLLGVGALLAAVLIPASASATAATAISIVSAGPDAANNPAVITVVVDDGNGEALTSMTVNVDTASGPVLLVPMSLVDATNPASQTWAATSPIAQGQLAPGTYTMTVNAADSTESDSALPVPAADMLPFTFGNPVISGLSSSPISFGNLSATIQGSLTGAPPWGADSDKATVGIPGKTVDLIDNDDPSHASTPIATTSSDGSFKATNIPETAGDTYQLVVSPDTTMGQAGAALTPDVIQDATRVAATVIPGELVYKKTPGSGSGTVQYVNNGVWTAPPQGFTVTVKTGTSKPMAAVTDDAKGDFKFTMPTTVGTSWSVQAGGGPLLGTSMAGGSVHVAVPVRFASSSMRIDSFGVVHASACLQVTAANFSPPASPRPQLQTAQHRDGPWHFLASLPHHSASGSCTAANESLFTVSKGAKYFPGAYYRELFPSGINFQRALTGVVHLAKITTAIVNATESPRTVKHGDKITFKGQLKQQVGLNARPFGNQHVVVEFQLPHSSTFDCIGINPQGGGTCRMFKTDAAGKFTATLADLKGSTNWAVQYNGGSQHFAARSRLFFITVTGGGNARGSGPPGIPQRDPPVTGAPIRPA